MLQENMRLKANHLVFVLPSRGARGEVRSSRVQAPVRCFSASVRVSRRGAARSSVPADTQRHRLLAALTNAQGNYMELYRHRLIGEVGKITRSVQIHFRSYECSD